MITISKQLLEQAGYNNWKDQNFGSRNIVNWQKCVRDETGKKYFINIDETHGWHPNIIGGEEFHNFWPSIQFDIEVPGFGFHSIEINLVQWFNESGKYSQITIEKMEEMVDQIWVNLKGLYYEKY